MKNYVLGILSIVFFCIISPQVFAGDAEDAAIKAAEKWLILIDANEYGKSWDEASELFKISISKEMWEHRLMQ